MKRPARKSFAFDRDPAAIAALHGLVPDGTELLTGCGIELLELCRFAADDFIYCDPPYLMETRRSGPMYRCEMTRRDHERLLTALLKVPCCVAICGYYSPLYAMRLAGWRLLTRPQMTRGGFAIEECLWLNYPQPKALHDYRYLGRDYREREKFARRRKRWLGKLARMTLIERRALLSAMQEEETAIDKALC